MLQSKINLHRVLHKIMFDQDRGAVKPLRLSVVQAHGRAEPLQPVPSHQHRLPRGSFSDFHANTLWGFDTAHLTADRRLLSCASGKKKNEEARRKTKTTKPGGRLVIFLAPIQSIQSHRWHKGSTNYFRLKKKLPVRQETNSTS